MHKLTCCSEIESTVIVLLTVRRPWSRESGGSGGCRILAVAAGKRDHSEIGEPDEAEGKDQPQEGGDQASPGRRDSPELVHCCCGASTSLLPWQQVWKSGMRLSASIHHAHASNQYLQTLMQKLCMQYIIIQSTGEGRG